MIYYTDETAGLTRPATNKLKERAIERDKSLIDSVWDYPVLISGIPHPPVSYAARFHVCLATPHLLRPLTENFSAFPILGFYYCIIYKITHSYATCLMVIASVM